MKVDRVSDQTDRYTVRALDRGLQLLLQLTSKDVPLSLEELSRRTNISQATAFRLLTTLEQRQLIRRNEYGGYQLGFACMELGGSFAASLDLAAEARAPMADLGDRFKQTVHLGTLDVDHGQVLYIERVATPELIGPMIARPGIRTPAHCTAMGKAMAAYLDPAAREAFLRLPRQASTQHSIINPDALDTELDLVRARGFSIDEQELVLGVHAAAAPIFDQHGHPTAGLSVGGIRDLLPIERLHREVAPAVLAAAAQITAQLGGKMPPKSKEETELDDTFA